MPDCASLLGAFNQQGPRTMNTPTPTNGNSSRAKAYSYLRFSTPEQERGDSFRRQTEAAQRYAEQNGLDLDDSLTLEDTGVSAFRGRNVQEGRLGAFINAVDTGHVRPGSYLLVESLDRLSRDRINSALSLFSSLLEKGITIVTLSDTKVYTKDSLNNIADLILSLLVMARAHEESAMKSHRMKAAWRSKREKAAASGTALTAMAPSWLRLNHDTREFELIEERAKVVRHIFAMYLDGYGKTKIAQRLNEDATPPLSGRSDGWHHSFIGRVLTNEAVIGRFQPMREVEPPEGNSPGSRRREADGDPIDGYFPAVIDDETFARARTIRRSKRMVGGPKGKTFSNVLSGLMTCGHCGAAMHSVNKGRPPKGNRYLSCSRARRKANGCDARSVRYDVVLLALLNSLAAEDLNLMRVIGANGDDREEDRRRTMLDVMDGVDGKITETDDAIESLLATLEKTKSDRARETLAGRLDDLEAQKVELEGEKEKLEDELRDLNDSTTSRETMIADVQRLVDGWNAVAEQSTTDPALAYDVNLRLNTALKRLIDNVAVAVHEGSREWIEGKFVEGWPWPHEVVEQKFRDVLQGLRRGVSMTVNFRNAEDRYLIIYADGRRPSRYVAVAARIKADGVVQSAELTASAM